MNRRLLIACLGLLLAYAPVHFAQAQTFVMPPNVNDNQTVISAPAARPALRIAIYEGPGAPAGDVKGNIASIRQSLPDAEIVRIPAEEWATVDLSPYQVVVFPGGTGGGQAKGLTPEGRENVKNFVRNGGGYYGVCAGAYLATTNYSWSLGIINAKTLYKEWKRGKDLATVTPTPQAQEVLGKVPDQWQVMYNNGPIFGPAGKSDLPSYTTLTTFQSEVRKNNNPEGEMLGTTAQAMAPYGKGRVFISSPHPEFTPGLENFMGRAILWTAGISQ